MLSTKSQAGIASSVDFTFVATKVRGRHRKLFEGDRLAALARLRSLGDIGAELLERREFVDHLDLERQIVGHHLAELLEIARLGSGPRRDIIDWLMARHLLENIKVVVRGIAAGETLSAVRPYLVEFPPPFDIDLDSLAERPELASIVNLIPYPEVAAAAGEQIEQAREPGKSYLIESAIDREYHNRLAALLQTLCRADQSSCSPLIGLEIDIYNILVILRGRFTYGLPPEDVEPLLANRGELATTELRRILDAGSQADAVAAIPGPLIDRARSVTNAGDIEAAMWSRLYHLANRIYYGSFFDLGAVLGFIYLKRVELLNFIRLIEMVRLKRPSDEILQRLVTAR